MAHVVRVWLLTPPPHFAHPKTEVLRKKRRRTLALRVRKVARSGQMRIVARGPSEDVAAFHGDLCHKQLDEGWVRDDEQAVTPNDENELTGRARGIERSPDEVAGGADSSGREREAPAAASDTSSVDTGSSASSRLVRSEVRRERERGEALLAAAAAREAAALEAAAAAAAAGDAAARDAAAREAAAREAAIVALMTHAHMTRAVAEQVLRGA
jgi:hypothetical protein